jgi:hypothetical protein
MKEFKPNPFKVKWEELIKERITKDTIRRFCGGQTIHSNWRSMVDFIISCWKEETAKNKEVEK